MLKIVITGPESTGKSTLAAQLALHFNATLVAEFARNYLTHLNRPYCQADLIEITKGQLKLEKEAIIQNSELIICDTSIEVIKIWSEVKYGNCDSFIITELYNNLPTLYLLMAPDLPWQPDPLRENPNDRDILFKLYKNELISSKIPFIKVSGGGNERLKIAIKVIENKLR